ncbi:MAG: hypothetical protein IKZ87_06915 [Actinomycetaceae bacterium]|nr:hypothetical protein [Actinomycetaceae bacterium]
MAKKLLGLIVAGIAGAVVAFVTMVLLGSRWKEAMPVSMLICVVFPFVSYYASRKSGNNKGN